MYKNAIKCSWLFVAGFILAIGGIRLCRALKETLVSGDNTDAHRLFVSMLILVFITSIIVNGTGILTMASAMRSNGGNNDKDEDDGI